MQAPAARHPLRAAIALPPPVEAPEAPTSDSLRQFVLGWLGGLVFFGTLFA